MSDPAIIMDSGSGYLKIGLSTDTFPRQSFPAMVGRTMLRYGETIGNVELKDIMIGHEAAQYRSFLELSHPVSEGIVSNWDDMGLVWKHGLNLIGVNDCRGRSCLLTEPVMNPHKNREKMAEIIFENFEFGRMFIGVQALMSLFAEARMTATLLDAGDGVTHCIPVYEGQVQNHLIQRLNVAGRHVTEHLVKLLQMRGYSFNSSADFETVREIKEKFCYVSACLSHDRQIAKQTTCLEKEYRLPDNSIIKIGRERFDAPEILFNPQSGGYEGDGTSDIVFNAINQAPMDCRRELYESILISGGTSMFPGFPTRLDEDVRNIYRNKILKNKAGAEIPIKIEVLDPPRRKYNVFIGAAFYAKFLENQEGLWVTKKEWEEQGKKCLNKLIV